MPAIGTARRIQPQAPAQTATLRPAADSAPLLGRAHAPVQPAFRLALAEAVLADLDSIEPIEPPEMSGICVPVPEAQPAVCIVAHISQPFWQWPVVSVAYPLPLATRALAAPAISEPADFAPMPAAEAVEVPLAASSLLERMETHIEVRLPREVRRLLEYATVPLAGEAAHSEPSPVAAASSPTSSFEGGVFSIPPVLLPQAGMSLVKGAAVAMAPACDYAAVPVESIPLVEPAVQPMISRLALHYPEFRFAEQEAVAMVADRKETQLTALAPAAAGVSPAPLEPVSSVSLNSPRHDLTAAVGTAIPEAPFQAVEFYCKRVASAATLNLAWMIPVPALRQPRFLLTAVLENLEQPLAAAPTKKKKDAAAEVFEITTARKARSWLRDIAKPLAACFLVGAFLWATVKTMHVATQTAAVNRDVATIIDAERSGPAADGSASSQTGSGANGAGPATGGTGLMATVRHAIAARAASQLTESFHEGMAAWSDGRKASPASWARSSEGYVRPAAFALFRPSADYRDYRVEFFGQIEQKSMSWAVRAHDPKNYYAMKMKVVEPGMRPVVAIEHYPVVDGRKGHHTQTPLPGLMLHNNTPYHVEVAVRGNRVTTSVEGQEVDSWTDDLLPKGGVGFFAENGERSRLYWMKVAKNEDFLGRICAYIAGGGSAATAELRPGSGSPSQPGSGWPAERADIALVSIFALKGPQQRRRSESWSL